MKIIFIDTCADCPYFKVRGSSASEKDYCGKNSTGITDIGLTPTWCPLPDASQQAESMAGRRREPDIGS